MGLVSVVIAAYNSSQRLVCAVESIRQQTVTDLEIVVVGDAATDDSAERLRDFDDDRIRWENLPVNWGEQSVPSNRGIDLARGDRVLFLNQDDIYLPDHVERILTFMEGQNLDVAWSPYLVLAPGARPGAPSPDTSNSLGGVTPHHPAFDPRTFIPASCTAWRRDALEALGGWRTAADVVVSPSQDLLWRAWRANMRMAGTPTPTVLVLWSGDRRGSYTAQYSAADNEAWLAAALDGSGAVEREIAACAVASASAAARPPSLRRAARAATTRAITWTSNHLGIHPDTVAVRRRYWRSGGFINAVRAGNDLGIRDFRAQRRTGSQ